MFDHLGESREFKHNIQIAIVLSFVAGIVNVSGFLSFSKLVTHITGHFSMLINHTAGFNFSGILVFFIYINTFLLGSFLSSFLIIKFKTNQKINAYFIPILLEALILVSIGFSSNFFEMKFPDLVICLLLFAMGLQNATVTKISSTVVRTTHLTGLFTDLGIEISQLFFPKTYLQQKRIRNNIELKMMIVSFFFLGGINGSFFYIFLNFKLNTLIVAAGILFVSLFYKKMIDSFQKS